MTGKFIAYILSVFTFFSFLLISISFFLYMGINERVHDICYDVAETVSTKGLISEEIFTYIKSNLSLYGEYELNFILEKHLEENTSVFYTERNKLKIFLKPRRSCYDFCIRYEPSLFEKITGKELRVSR